MKGRKQRLEGNLGKGDQSALPDVISRCSWGAHLTARGVALGQAKAKAQFGTGFSLVGAERFSLSNSANRSRT